MTDRYVIIGPNGVPSKPWPAGARLKLPSLDADAAIAAGGYEDANQFDPANAGDVAGLTSINSGQLGGYRNAVLNGGFDIWQRGTSFAALGWTADRWHFLGPTPSTISRQGGFSGSRYCLRFGRDTGATDTTYWQIFQKIESFRVARLAGRTVRLSFTARRGVGHAGDFTLVSLARYGASPDEAGAGIFVNYSTSGSASVSAAHTITTAAQRFVHTMTVPVGSQAMLVGFYALPVGTALADEYVEIADVQLEIGETETPFEHRPYALELAACQRYYERGGGEQALQVFCGAHCYSTTAARGAVPFKVRKRGAPTVAMNGAAATWAVDNASGSQLPATSIAAQFISPDGFELAAGVASGLVAGNAAEVRANNSLAPWWAAEAELP